MLEREKVERFRAAVATCFLMPYPKKSGQPWEVWDVFPELREAVREQEERDAKLESQRILMKFQIMAARQKQRVH